VTVDLWGTLLLDPPMGDDRYKRRRMADFETILKGLGIEVRATALDRAYEKSARVLGGLWSRNKDVPVTEHVNAILAAVDGGLPTRVPAETMAALVDAYAHPVLLVPPAVDPGAGAALARLRSQGVLLALVCNTMRSPGATLRTLLDRFGLLHCFAHTTFSDEVGIRKPDPEIFALTLRALAVEPAVALHVGDDPVLDVLGARRAGLRTVQVTSASLETLGDARPDAVVPSLGALPDALAALERA
jgi:putative hydrolase of the HAD superfamily